MTEDGGTLRSNRVGYGHPPTDHRIKPGEVRNPHGRAGKPGPKEDFLAGIVRIKVDGKFVKVTRYEALDHMLMSAAAKGVVGAAKELDRRQRERARTANTVATQDAVSPEHLAALDRFVERRMKELQADKVAAESVVVAPGDKK